MRAIVIGGSGQIGTRIVDTLESRRHICLATTYSQSIPFFYPLDIRNDGSLHELFADFRPEVVFMAAGTSSHSYAAAHPETASELLVESMKTLVDSMRIHGGRLVIFSGDGVFGDCATAKREEDTLAPVGQLANMHASMEEILRDRLPNRHLVIRTSRVYGDSVRRVARRLASGTIIRADNVRMSQPTFVNDLAEAAVDLAERGHTGTLHVTGPDRHTDFAFARLVAHLYGHDADQIQPLAEADGLRPAKVWLDRFAARRLCGPDAIRPVADAIRLIRDRSARVPAMPALRAA